MTPLTHSLLNVSKRVIVVMSTMLYFNDLITTHVLVSLAILAGGFILYELQLDCRMCAGGRGRRPSDPVSLPMITDINN